ERVAGVKDRIRSPHPCSGIFPTGSLVRRKTTGANPIPPKAIQRHTAQPVWVLLRLPKQSWSALPDAFSPPLAKQSETRRHPVGLPRRSRFDGNIQSNQRCTKYETASPAAWATADRKILCFA